MTMSSSISWRSITYPAANLNGIVLDIPRHYQAADDPSDAEIKTALNNGFIPLAYRRKAVRMIRYITNRSLNDQSANDYRAREGHIPRCMHFGWEQFYASLAAQMQPNADDDPADDQPPPALTTTPSAIKAVHSVFIDAATSSSPLFGTARYPGPIFKPSARDEMKKNFVSLYNGGGSFDLTANWKVVEHLIKTGTVVNELSASY